MKKHIGEAVAMILVITALVALLMYDSSSGFIDKAAPAIVVQQSWNVPDEFSSKMSNSVDMQLFKGKVVLLDFWATWCHPCVQSIPHLKKIHQDYSDRGLVIIGYTDPSSQNLDHFIKSYEIPYIIAVGPSAGAYEIHSIPQAVLIDKKGIVRSVSHPMHVSAAMIEQLLKEEE